MDERDRRAEAEDEELAAEVVPATPTRELVELAVATALAVSLAFQAKTMAYNNYGTFKLEFFALEFVVALGAACVVRVGDIAVARGARWASSYVSRESGWPWHLLASLPPAALCATVMCALLSVANVAVVKQVFYRETVELLPVAILMRFLADIPTAVAACLVVRLAYPKLRRRLAKKQA